MIKAVLFDLDGTIINSEEGITKCVQYALHAYGIDEPDRTKLRCFIGPPLDPVFREKYGMTEADAWRLCEKYDMLSPCYQHSKRNGCWFCPNASTSELSHMVNRHPDLFEKLIEWEHTDNLYHRRLTRTETPSEIKARLSGKSQPEFSISNQ